LPRKPYAVADNVVFGLFAIDQGLIDFPLQLRRLRNQRIEIAQRQAAALTKFMVSNANAGDVSRIAASGIALRNMA
jgi:hypothetical protein